LAGCVGLPTTFSITVNPLPVLTAITSQTVCPATTTAAINFTSTPVGAAVAWTNSNATIGIGASGTGNIAGFAGTNTGSTVLTGNFSAVPTLAGCVGLPITFSVTVNPLPVITATSNSPICEGASLNLTASGGLTYSWSGPNFFSSTVQNPVISTTTPLMAGNYIVSATDANGCPGANITIVAINPLPLAPATSNSTYCKNDNATSLVSNVTATGTLNWYANPTGGTASSTAPTPLTTTPGTATYYVSQTVSTCEGPRALINVITNPLPTGTFIGMSSCAPLSTTFTLNSTNTITNYSWNMGDGTVNSIVNSIVYTYTNAGLYNIVITIKDNNNCTNTVAGQVTVFANPTANFTYEPQSITTLEPDVTFADLSMGSNLTYAWNFGDSLNTVSFNQNPNFTYPHAGVYMVQLAIKDGNNCVDTIYKPLTVLQDFVVYIPNAFSPNGDGINEEFFPQGVGIAKEKYNFMIFDRWGEMIFSSTDIDNHWNGKKQGHDKLVQEDTYIYKLICRSVNGEKFSKTGHVHVVR